MQLIRADGTEITKPEKKLWGLNQRDAAEKGDYFISRGVNPAIWGLNRADGTELIPAVYDKVNVIKDLVFARVRPYGLTTTSETLYQTNGKLLMQGCFRYMGFEGEEWDPYNRFLTVQTPLGTEYCKVIDHERIQAQKKFQERNKRFLKAMHERDVPAKYLVDDFLPRMRECKTEEERDKARDVTAAEIEEKFPYKERCEHRYNTVKGIEDDREASE